MSDKSMNLKHCRSMTFWYRYGSGCGSGSSDPGSPKNIRIWIRNTSKKSQKSHKTVEIKIFLIFYLTGRVGASNGSGCGSGRPKNIRILRIRMQNTVVDYDYRTCPGLECVMVCAALWAGTLAGWGMVGVVVGLHLHLLRLPVPEIHSIQQQISLILYRTCNQGCGSGSELDPDSIGQWIRIQEGKNDSQK